MAAENDTTALKCGNAECNVATEHRCIEGTEPLDACLHFGKVIPIAIDGSQTNLGQSRPVVDLLSAATLAADEALDHLRQENCRVVAIVAPFDAGKTSLIAGLYDLFQTGAVQQFEFASSLSLHAFEEAAHDSRAASRREDPEMNRTPIGPVRFYHLALVDRDFDERVSLLLGDRSGESYFSSRNEPTSAREFPELSRADVVTMIVDGSRLAKLDQRNNVTSEVKQMLQAFIEAGVTRSWQRLALVVTKLDAVRKAGNAAHDRALADVDALMESMDRLFGSSFAQIEKFFVAASPKSGEAKRGEGVPALLDFWFMHPLRYEQSIPEPAAVESMRYFARLKAPAQGGASHE